MENNRKEDVITEREKRIKEVKFAEAITDFAGYDYPELEAKIAEIDKQYIEGEITKEERAKKILAIDLSE